MFYVYNMHNIVEKQFSISIVREELDGHAVSAPSKLDE
jgi:hypothetical protein